MKKICLVALLVLLVLTNGIAQRDFTVNQYMFSGIFTNPGYAGSGRYGNVTALHRSDFSGSKAAPQSQYLSYSARAGMSNAGLGALLLNERSGASQQVSAYGVYAYHLKMSKEGTRLSFGLRAGVSSIKINLTDISILDSDDPIFMSDVRYTHVRIGGGLYYYTKQYYAGFSFPYILDYRINAASSKSNPFSAFNFIAGYVYKYSENLLFKPTLLARYDQSYLSTTRKHYDVNAGVNALLVNRIWIGGTINSVKRMSLIAELKVNQQLRMGYAYSYNLSNQNNVGLNSAHELMLSWDLNCDLTNMRNPRYF